MRDTNVVYATPFRTTTRAGIVIALFDSGDATSAQSTSDLSSFVTTLSGWIACTEENNLSTSEMNGGVLVLECQENHRANPQCG